MISAALVDLANSLPEGRYYSDIYVNNVWRRKKPDFTALFTYLPIPGAPNYVFDSPELLSTA